MRTSRSASRSRSHRTLTGFTVATLCAFGTACSSSGDASDGPFAGVWVCNAVSALTYTTPPNSTPQETQSKETLQVRATGSTITTQATSDAGTSCPQTFTVSGSSVTLDLPSTCAAQGDTFTYSAGTGSVTNGTWTLTLDFAFAGTVADDGGTVSVAGTGTTTEVCTR